MTRDEIATALIVAEVGRTTRPFDLTNPRPLNWTTFPAPAIYILIDNALFIADSVLAPRVIQPTEGSETK